MRGARRSCPTHASSWKHSGAPQITSTVAAMPSNADEWREMRGRTASSVAVSGSSAERAQQDALAAE